ncbi:hypothetical protein LZ31DRAFT_337891 [Colletotrichum somersetense]|nr:hypothetical protein LZ31DRAFT_337891 [Colletotrichum somersetense]
MSLVLPTSPRPPSPAVSRVRAVSAVSVAGPYLPGQKMELAASQRSNRKSRAQEPPGSQRRDTKTSESGKLPKPTVEPVPPSLRGRDETKQSTRRLFVRLPAKPPPPFFSRVAQPSSNIILAEVQFVVKAPSRNPILER